jgi:hypothetical protein
LQDQPVATHRLKREEEAGLPVSNCRFWECGVYKDTYNLMKKTVMPMIKDQLKELQESSIVTVYHQSNKTKAFRSYTVPNTIRPNTIGFIKATSEDSGEQAIRMTYLYGVTPMFKLSINGQTVTRRIHAAIHQQQHFVPLQQYYRSRFHWHQETFDDIDWTNFAIVY